MELNSRELGMALSNPKKPDEGSHLERFDAGALSRTLMYEVQKAEAMGLDNIKITMNLQDTMDLAQCLARASLLGA